MIRALLLGVYRVLLLLSRLVVWTALVLYLSIVRTFLFLLALYVLAYFASGTTAVRDLLTQVVADSIPGNITMATLQWGPNPWSLRFTDVSIRGARGEEVVRAEAVEAEVKLLATATGLLTRLATDRAPLAIKLRSVRLLRPWVRVEVGADGYVGVAEAFYVPKPDEPEDDEPKTLLDLTIGNAFLESGSAEVETPQVSLRLSGIDVDTNFALVGEGRMRFLAPRASVAEVDFDLAPELRPTPVLERFHLPLRDLVLRRIRWDGLGFDFQRATAQIEEGGLVAAGGMDLEPEVPAWSLQVGLDLPATSKVLPELLGGLVRGETHLNVRGEGTLGEVTCDVRLRSPGLDVSGFPASDVEVALGIEPAVSPTGRLTHAFRLHEAALGLLGGRMSLGPTTFRPSWAEVGDGEGPARSTLVDFATSLDMTAVSPVHVLASPFVGLAADALPFLAGSLDGRIALAGAIDEATGRLDLRAYVDGLTMTWAGGASVPLAERYAITGGLDLALAPAGGSLFSEGLLEPVARLGLADVRLDSGEDRVEIDGDLDLGAGGIDAEVDLAIADLGRFLGAFGVEDVGGRLELEEARIGGSFDDPAVRARLRVLDGRVADQDLGTVEASVDLSHGLVTIDGLSAETRVGAVRADADLRLWRGTTSDPDPELPFHVSRLEVHGIALHEVAPDLGVETVVTVDGSDISGHLADVLGTLRGEARIKTTEIAVAGEKAQRLSAVVRADPQRLSVENLILTLERGELVRVDASMEKRSKRLHVRAQTAHLPFDAVAALRAEDSPLHGRVSADVTLDGTLERPFLAGAVALEDFAFGDIHLGDGAFLLKTPAPGRLDLAPQQDFSGLTLLSDSHVLLDGFRPTHVLLRVEAGETPVFEVLPFLAMPDADLRASGTIELELWLDATPLRWELRVDAPADEVSLEVDDGEIVYRNLAAFYLVLDSGGVHLGPVPFGRNLDDSVTVCGDIRFEEPLAVDLQIGGRVHLDVLGPIRTGFSVLEGAIAIGPDRETAARVGQAICLPGGDDRILSIEGPVTSPRISGVLQPEDVKFVPRGMASEFRIRPESTIVLRPEKGGRVLRVVLPEARNQRLGGEMDDGLFAVWGELVLEDLAPKDADVHVVGNDLFYSSAGEFNVTFNPDLRIVARDLDTEGRGSLRVKGEVLVTEGSYYKSFDRLGQAFGGGPAPETYSRPITEEVPLLRALAMDLRVRAEEFEVRSKFPFGRTDLETRLDLQVAGGLDDLQIHRRVEVLPGGQIFYDIIRREFEFVRGYVEFDGDPERPFLDLELQTVITYLASVGDAENPEEREVTVSVGIKGVPPTPQISFWSKDDPTLTTADLQSLILTGRPGGEGDRSLGGVGIQYDFGKVLEDIIGSAIFDALNVRVDTEGRVTTEIVNELGRLVRIRTRVIQETEETRVTAGFRFEISDSLSLEGNLQRVENATNPTQTYEARFKYRIPLD